MILNYTLTKQDIQTAKINSFYFKLLKLYMPINIIYFIAISFLIIESMSLKFHILIVTFLKNIGLNNLANIIDEPIQILIGLVIVGIFFIGILYFYLILRKRKLKPGNYMLDIYDEKIKLTYLNKTRELLIKYLLDIQSTNNGVTLFTYYRPNLLSRGYTLLIIIPGTAFTADITKDDFIAEIYKYNPINLLPSPKSSSSTASTL